jgi:hypothetical protein
MGLLVRDTQDQDSGPLTVTECDWGRSPACWR